MSSFRSLLLAALALAATLTACDKARPLANDGSGSSQCTACHGYPPPPGILTPAAEHPNNTNCHACHPGTVDANGNIIPASAGGLHENGKIDVVSGHPSGFADPAVHGPVAISDLSSCQACHGTDFAGGTVGVSCNACHGTNGFADWQTNCTFCHGTRTQGYTLTAATAALAAPPQGVHGETLATDPAVGAHQRHLGATTYVNPIACGTCHVVPTDVSHVQGQAATITFSGVAAGSTFDGATCTTYCHGATLPTGSGGGGTNETPSWTQSGVACTWCHSNNPTTGRHPAVFSPHSSFLCATCHPAGYSQTAVVKATHVNGTVDLQSLVGFSVSSTGVKSCNPACHGQQNW